jgi:hypothetical protein
VDQIGFLHLCRIKKASSFGISMAHLMGWESVPCCIYGELPIYVNFIPKNGTWTLRDVYQVCEACSREPMLEDIKVLQVCGGGFGFPGTQESTALWRWSTGDSTEDMELEDMEIRTHGVGSSWVNSEDWRQLPTQDNFDEPMHVYNDKIICLRAKCNPPLGKVVAFVTVLSDLGHHIVQSCGFALEDGVPVRIGPRVKKVYINAATVRALRAGFDRQLDQRAPA